MIFFSRWYSLWGYLLYVREKRESERQVCIFFFKNCDFVLHFKITAYRGKTDFQTDFQVDTNHQNSLETQRRMTAFLLVVFAVFLPFFLNAGRYLPAEPIQLRLVAGIVLTQGTLFGAAVLPFLFPPEKWQQVCGQLGLRRLERPEVLRVLKQSVPLFAGITICSSLLTSLGKWFGEKNPTQPLVELLIQAPFSVFLIIFVSAVMIAPVVEELAFRRVLYSGLKMLVSPVAAAVVTSLLFALVHAVIWQVPALFLLALFFQREYVRAGEKTTYTIFLHACYNFLTILCAFGLRLYYLYTGRML